jgi:V-type H+-transporting ATPase proteolipid subunit
MLLMFVRYKLSHDLCFLSVSSTNYSDFRGFASFGAGLSVGLSNLAAGMSIGIVGDAGVRANAQQPRYFSLSLSLSLSLPLLLSYL